MKYFMSIIKNRLILSILLLAIVISYSSDLQAQIYFGKNKVQYTNFNWQVLRTEHFRIYFYPEEEMVAKIAARIAEDSYHQLASRFKHEIYKSTPLIIYSSPNYFSQTNVISILMPEAVAGFTEYMKGRVVIPFNGSYSDFDHVIRHELVHVFTFSKLEAVMSHQKLMRMAPPPLWFIEGLAEYWSSGWDSEADMVIKDMVLSGRLYPVPRLYELDGSYFIYKLGQSVCRFINDEYGSDKLVLILENWWKGKDFEEIIEITLSEKIEKLSEKWEYQLKKKYFPEMAEGGLANQETKRLTGIGYSLKAVPISIMDGPDKGDWVVFKANRRGYSGLYMMSKDGEKKKLFTLLKGERSANFESLHLMQSGIDARNSGLILFSSKSEEADVLYLYDLHLRRVIKKYEIPGIIAISSPHFSPDEKSAIFSGADKSGIADLYIVNLENGTFSRLTNDFYDDNDPIFNDTGDSVIFSSDRCPNGDEGAVNLFMMAVNGGEPIALTSGLWRDKTPSIYDGTIYFSSDRDSASNIYRLNKDGSINKLTSLLTGAYDPRPSRDGKEVIFSGYQDFGYHIYRAATTDSIRLIPDNPKIGKTFWKPGTLDSKYMKSSVQYRTDYSFDIAQSALSYDPVYGSIGGMQMALSDMLGNHTYYFLLTNTAESKDEFWSSFNIAVTYINRQKRFNWGAGVFHLYDEYYNDYEGYYYERQAGGLLHFNYPLSKFNRLEATSYVRYSDKNQSMFGIKRRALLLSNYFSIVSDNSLWDISGPIEGHRYNITIGLTSAVDKGQFYNRMGLIDIRHYFRLGMFSAFASRLFAYTSTGVEPQRIYFGGSWSFRGYDRQAFYSRNILFASHELRFPLVDNLLIGFPFGGIGFQAIRGAIFFDVGSAWDNKFDQFLGSFGTGFRMALGRVVLLRFDFSRTTDFTKISSRTKFDFFFGWNF
jgi:Tol biopolymer transport system component